jgi:hypothetical protein
MATGGSPPYGFTLSGQPEWMSIDGPTGRIFGIPTSAGEYSITVTVFDSETQPATALLSLLVSAPSELAIIVEVPDANTGDLYNAQVVVGGASPYEIAVTSGMLPAGLSFGTDGRLSGTPTRIGDFTFGISVTDANQTMVSGMLSISVTMQTGLRITIGDEVPVYTGTDARVGLGAEGGTPPYQWSLVQGQLQSGLSLDPAGFIVGRVTLASTATVTLQVTDAAFATDTAVVYVRAQPFRTGSSGRTGGGRDGGCGCDTSGEMRTEYSGALLMLLGLALVFRRRL